MIQSQAVHDEWMRAALHEAKLALGHGDVPIGAVILRPIGSDNFEIIAARHNERELTNDPTAHAEILALRDAAQHIGSWRLENCLAVVTLEPCAMCAGALVSARINGVIFGAVDLKAGALGSLYNLGQDPRLNHEFPIRAGVLADECATLLTDFFSSRRTDSPLH